MKPDISLATYTGHFNLLTTGCGRTLLVLLAVLSAVLRSISAASQNRSHPHRGCKRAVFVFAALLLLTGATAQAQTDVLSATLTVKDLGTSIVGCTQDVPAGRCSDFLSEDEFTYGSTDYTITALFLRPNGLLEITFDPALRTDATTLTLDVAGTAFDFEDATTKGARNRVWKFRPELVRR